MASKSYLPLLCPSEIPSCTHTGRCTFTTARPVTLKVGSTVPVAWPVEVADIWSPWFARLGIPELKDPKFLDLRLPRFCHLGDGRESEPFILLVWQGAKVTITKSKELFFLVKWLWSIHENSIDQWNNLILILIVKLTLTVSIYCGWTLLVLVSAF